MLDVPHFQVVFTLPSELRAVAHRNPRIVYRMMVQVGAAVLAELAEQRLGARLGITGVLHTWANNLNLHPHWHCLVTAGGLSTDGERWIETRKDFLFPIAVIARMYRGRMLERLIDAHRNGDFNLGAQADSFGKTLRTVAKRHRQWGVHVDAPGDRPVGHVLKYLARYMYTVAISNQRIIGVTETHVGFRARDSDSDGKQRDLWLEGSEFVRRFLLHVLPKGFQKVRHYGLYAAGLSARAREKARRLLPNQPPPGRPTELEVEAILSRCERELAARELAKHHCPGCGERMSVEALSRTQMQSGTARGPP